MKLSRDKITIFEGGFKKISIISNGNMTVKDDANSANIPVNIWLTENDEGNGYLLTADNYMPRLTKVIGEEYREQSENREELVELIKNHIIPLYEVALSTLQNVCEGKEEGLYYWEKEKVE